MRLIHHICKYKTSFPTVSMFSLAHDNQVLSAPCIHFFYLGEEGLENPSENWEMEKWSEQPMHSQERCRQAGPDPKFLKYQHQFIGCPLSFPFSCCGGHSSSPRGFTIHFNIFVVSGISSPGDPQLEHRMVRSRLGAHLGCQKVQQFPCPLLPKVLAIVAFTAT